MYEIDTWHYIEIGRKKESRDKLYKISIVRQASPIELGTKILMKWNMPWIVSPPPIVKSGNVQSLHTPLKTVAVVWAKVRDYMQSSRHEPWKAPENATKHFSLCRCLSRMTCNKKEFEPGRKSKAFVYDLTTCFLFYYIWNVTVAKAKKKKLA